LIVDEVLAVGDAEFQKKCLGKMKDVSTGEGRTVLFVSHNMAAVKSLCTNGIFLKEGNLFFNSTVNDVISQYLTHENNKILNAEASFTALNMQDAFFVSARVLQNNITCDNIDMTQDFYIELSYSVLKKINGLTLSFSLYTADGTMVFYCPNQNTASDVGTYISRVCIPKKFLAPNNYYINIGLSIPMIQLFDIKESPLKFTIIDTGTDYFQYHGQNLGLVLVNYNWQTTKQ
jgi:lipopolysaccharide transport system ATP-binding protein